MPETAKTDAINDINHALKADQLRHRIAGEFSLDDIGGAHELIEGGNIRGCVVVNVSE
jgi:NADPH:quinone reductase-like Zn-dependent oxidoreductase